MAGVHDGDLRANLTSENRAFVSDEVSDCAGFLRAVRRVSCGWGTFVLRVSYGCKTRVRRAVSQTKLCLTSLIKALREDHPAFELEPAAPGSKSLRLADDLFQLGLVLDVAAGFWFRIEHTRRFGLSYAVARVGLDGLGDRERRWLTFRHGKG